MNVDQKWKNEEGYKDPTATVAMDKYEKNPDKGLQVIQLMIRIADLGGFDVQGRIWLKERDTGKEYR